MGLPRASGKRSWSGEEGEDSVPPTKVLCTSPPHALCAEDVMHHPHLTHAHASTHSTTHTSTHSSSDSSKCEITQGNESMEEIEGATPIYEHSSEDEQSDDDFIDDEEDKDSGFIDSNSIDNSSDDDEGRVLNSESPSKSSVESTSLQLSLSQVLAHPPTPIPTSNSSTINENEDSLQETETSTEDSLQETSTEDSLQEPETHEDSLQEPETHEDSLQEPETHEDSLQEPETHEDSLQETETHEDSLQETETREDSLQETETHEDSLQETETHEDSLQETETSTEDSHQETENSEMSSMHPDSSLCTAELTHSLPSSPHPLPSLHSSESATHTVPSLHTPEISSTHPVPSLHTTEISSTSPVPSLHTPETSSTHPVPSLHNPETSSTHPVPSTHPIPSLHTSETSSTSPIPSLHSPETSSMSPIPSLHTSELTHPPSPHPMSIPVIPTPSPALPITPVPLSPTPSLTHGPPSPISVPIPSIPTSIPSPLPSPIPIVSPIISPAPFSPLPIMSPSLPLAATTHTSTPATPLTTITVTTTHTSPSPNPLLTHTVPSPLALPSPTPAVSSPSTTSAVSRDDRAVGQMSGLTTVTATQTATVVTSTYQGALPSPAYEPHHFTYTGESYPPRPSTPGWESCNYYDGTQPATNKYMEISPSKSSSSQSIQCDENGKSYLELGSASPYTHTFSNECGNYTTSPSGYPQPYNQTYTSPSTYGQPNLYYNPRQSYSPNPYVYPNGENYTSFEGENGCSYAYGAYPGRTLPARGPPRCMSPFCDPTRGNPRPACYNQQRLSVLNLSMFKLNRFRQFPDPSLHRSVLICNTLRHIERELEAEGVSVASILAHSHAHTTHPHLQGASPSPGTPPCPESIPSSLPASPAASEGPLPPMHSPLVGSPLAAPVSPPPSTPTSPGNPYSPSVNNYPAVQYLPEEHTPAYDGRETVHLRAYPTSPSGTTQGPSVGVEEGTAEPEESSPPPASPRPQPSPQEERTDAINWCSVLSLSSQTDLDSMNNNEYSEWSGEGSSNMDLTRPDDAPPWKLPSLSADDVLKSFPEASKRLEANEDLDSIINVLVGS